MDKRAFLKYLPKIIGGGLGASAVAVLQWRADNQKEVVEKLDSRTAATIEKLEGRIRELEIYSSATVTKIQFLLSERKA